MRLVLALPLGDARLTAARSSSDFACLAAGNVEGLLKQTSASAASDVGGPLLAATRLSRPTQLGLVETAPHVCLHRLPARLGQHAQPILGLPVCPHASASRAETTTMQHRPLSGRARRPDPRRICTMPPPHCPLRGRGPSPAGSCPRAQPAANPCSVARATVASCQRPGVACTSAAELMERVAAKGERKGQAKGMRQLLRQGERLVAPLQALVRVPQ